MGCGASAKTIISEDNLGKMCQDGCRRMQVICIKSACDGDIKIGPPSQVQELQGCCEKLKEYAAKLDAPAKPADKDGEATEEKKGGGGGLLGAMKDGAAKATQAAGDVTKMAASTGLSRAAGGLKELVDKIDAPFQTVAKDVMDEKKTHIYNTFVENINGFVFKEPIKIVRGEHCTDAQVCATKYNAVADDTITRTLAALSKDAILKKLLPQVTEEVSKHAVTKTWISAQKAYTAAFAMAENVVSEADLAKAGVKKVEVDLNEYITLKMYEDLVERMAKTEKDVRANPQGKDVTEPQKQRSFATIFSAQLVYEEDYTLWEKEGSTE